MFSFLMKNFTFHFILFVKKLSDHLNLFKVLIKLVLSHRVSNHLFHGELILLRVRNTNKSVFFVIDLLLEFSLEFFIKLITQESFLSSVVLNKVRLESPNKVEFSDLFLSFHTLFHFILL